MVNDAADEAADFGDRRFVLLLLMLVVTSLVFVVVGTLLSLTFIVFSLLFLVLWLIMIDDLGGTGSSPSCFGLLVLLVKGVGWSFAVRDRAFLPGPPQDFGVLSVIRFLLLFFSSADVDLWPYTPGLLVQWASFLGSLHRPAGGLDLGVGGTSYVELLILYELLAARGCLWKRLILGIFVLGVLFQCRLFLLVQALIFGAHVVLLVLL